MWYAQRNVIISLVTVFVVLPMCFPRCALVHLPHLSTSDAMGATHSAHCSVRNGLCV